MSNCLRSFTTSVVQAPCFDPYLTQMKETIEEELRKLEGKLFWFVTRAADMLSIQIGDQHTVTNRHGSRTLGTFALHIDCPWEWSDGEGSLIANVDSALEPLSDILSKPVRCEDVYVRYDGAFRLFFSDHSTLDVWTWKDDHDESWRMFMPGTDARHFVVGAGGVIK
jgi:hypothetical protein